MTGELVRVVDHAVRFGVTVDEGDGDGWPHIRAKMLEVDVLVIATPIWMGQPSSDAKMVLERLDAESSETDEEGRLVTFGKVAAVAVVGNEDGAHHVTAEVMQSLNDVGFTVAASGSTYWVGEAMHTTDYQELESRPEKTASATKTAAATHPRPLPDLHAQASSARLPRAGGVRSTARSAQSEAGGGGSDGRT